MMLHIQQINEHLRYLGDDLLDWDEIAAIELLAKRFTVGLSQSNPDIGYDTLVETVFHADCANLPK